MFLFLIFASIALKNVKAYDPHFSMVAPTVEIDLTSDPSTLWSKSVDTILRLHGWSHSFEPVFKAHNESLFKNIPSNVLSQFSEAIRAYYPRKYDELKGISSAFHKNGHYVSVDYLAGWVYFHELGHTEWQERPSQSYRECTGILSSYYDSEGKLRVLHGRNMDNGPESIKNLTMHHVFKNGPESWRETVYESFTWYWFTTGFVTGKFGKFGTNDGVTVQENWRFEKISSSKCVEFIRNGTLPQVWFFREAFEKHSSFKEMVNFFETTPIIVGMYIITTNQEDGVIISRESGTGQLPIYRLSTTYESYLVQTNYDRWEPDPISDPRRTVAENQMKGVTRISEVSFFAALSTFPVRNEGTAYTCVLQAAINATMKDQCFIVQAA